MDHRTRYRGQLARAALLLCGLLLAGSCQWQAPAMRSRYADWAPDGVDADSMHTVIDNYERMTSENKQLRDQVARLKVELADSEAQLAHQKKLNDVTSDELRYAKSDLERVERQFVSFEERLTRQDSKASAVAAIAEVQLVYERVKQERPTALDRATRAEIDQKIETADGLMEERKYAAAVYFAERAMRIITSSESRAGLDPEGVRRVVAVTTANLRGGPGQTFSIVDQVAYGTVLVELSRKKDWYRVQLTDGREGWIHKSLLR